MFGGQDGLRRIMSQDTLKPKKVSETLARFGYYFRPYWAALALSVLLVVVATWTQVVTPGMIGQVVDCYLTQPAATALADFPGAETLGTTAGNNCTYEPDAASLTVDERLAGLGGLILQIVGLYVLGSVLTGLTFFTMSWTGQHVLRAMRIDLEGGYVTLGFCRVGRRIMVGGA